MWFSEGYRLEEVGGSEARVLKRPGGYALATFGSGVNPKNIRGVAEADKRHLEALKARSKFGLDADPESALMFEEGVREARMEYLLALEVAYR